MNTPDELYSMFFHDTDKVKELVARKTPIVFHCEFSMHRGPQMYNLMRQTDRKINENRYPLLFYPEIYLLEGGYKDFYKIATVRLYKFNNLGFL